MDWSVEYFTASIGLAMLVVFLFKMKWSGELCPPVAATMVAHIINFKRVHDFLCDHHKRYKTYRIAYPTRSYVFTTDPANVEHILRSNFANYVKGKFNHDIIEDLLGDGIFNIDGEQWRQQRKLASFEFSTKVLKDFSSVVFRENAVKLSKILLEACGTKQTVEMQVKPDILSRFVSLSEKHPEDYSDKYLRDIILNFMIAGRDTTAVTLCWFLHLLCNNPDVEGKVLQEIRDLVKENECMSIEESISMFSQNLSHTVLDNMHYLQAALSEALRLHPAVPVDAKYVVSDDILPDGFKIKKGDLINYVPYSMGRMTYLWGSDAEEFRPERWLEKGVFKSQSPFKFTAFQAGPRICLGKDFAYMQMKIFAAVLVRFFKFETVEGKEVKYRPSLTLHMTEDGLNLRVKPRLAC